MQASLSQKEAVNADVSTNISSLQSQVAAITHALLAQNPSFSDTSCSAISPLNPSAYYWVRASNGSAVCVYTVT